MINKHVIGRRFHCFVAPMRMLDIAAMMREGVRSGSIGLAYEKCCLYSSMVPFTISCSDAIMDMLRFMRLNSIWDWIKRNMRVDFFRCNIFIFIDTCPGPDDTRRVASVDKQTCTRSTHNIHHHHLSLIEEIDSRRYMRWLVCLYPTRYLPVVWGRDDVAACTCDASRNRSTGSSQS